MACRASGLVLDECWLFHYVNITSIVPQQDLGRDGHPGSRATTDANRNHVLHQRRLSTTNRACQAGPDTA